MLIRDIAKTSGAVSVLITSTVVCAANPSRVELTIVNDSVNVVYLTLGTSVGVAPTAVASSGIRLNASGGAYSTDGFTGAVAGIAVGGTSVITVTEL